ncbi:DUF4264 family protein [Acetivibrio saccincola]|jgi:hypothetical protein|uniref:DUF4264 domain-containing protein n=1 Tax=Acetivibrio saccincola TaxID=1677857 RepID=A0A2K9ELU7_9FIRM|nr:DUF4264 family protein [Acetivibrio saccincola]AUG57561.1 hypothetical protein HVS_08255 [Acetivibrio saccincola]NLW26058.1 DUF4264 family protein [Acetivibrio saccincola]PQQ67471.1 DUF4264 domain-containing protein [Acetivibrio saccincola]HOA98242.1 DUF4264 family protein [Acetivibrio saccincola]HQD29272.1 DUF4264 family protein [Acetivibrio saccincola]
MSSEEKLDLKSVLELDSNMDLYKVVDFLNKNLKDKNLLFGLTMNNNKMRISIYETA